LPRGRSQGGRHPLGAQDERPKAAARSAGVLEACAEKASARVALGPDLVLVDERDHGDVRPLDERPIGRLATMIHAATAGAGQRADVAASADTASSLDSAVPSFRKALQTQAPAHLCLTYSANG
jgi:hypothetical protein